MTALGVDYGQCVEAGNLTICLGPEMECRREEREEPRWCFGCRKRIGGTHKRWASVMPSYYDPHWSYCCDGCGKDRRLGFGMVWADDQ